MTAFYDTAKNYNRILQWDEENRLIKTVDTTSGNSVTTSYTYDAKGMRIIKDGPYGKSVYIDTGYVETNEAMVSNHVFMGNTRVASIVKHKDELQPATYYYASDHLGSSSVLTNNDGSYHERIEYLPYGEVWVEDAAINSNYRTPYKFTGKELDKETGLYYFGARYYDARMSRWISTDPALEKYIPTIDELKRLKKEEEKKNEIKFKIFNDDIEKEIKDIYSSRYKKLKGNGGVYLTRNIDMYKYALNNPIMYIDPDGNADLFIIVEGDLVGITGVEGSAGFVIDLSKYRDTGLFISGGPAAGGNVGIGVGAGFVKRDIEGGSINFDINFGAISLTVIIDEKGINGACVTIGPGKGGSSSYTITKTIKAGDVADMIVNYLKKLTKDK